MPTETAAPRSPVRFDVTAVVQIAAAAVACATAWWLLPATVRVVGWTGGAPVRIALLAPLSRLWTAIAVCAAAAAGAGALAAQRGAIGAFARFLAPWTLLLFWAAPYVPWGGRLPLLLVFSGPLRWAVVAVSAGASALPFIIERPRAAPRISGVAVVVLSFAIYAALGVRSVSEPGLGGDQPHYLVITHSLLVDHDLDISNNHAQRDYRAFYGGTLRPDYLQRGRHGEIYSVHAPGLPLLLLPAYASAGAAGAVVFVGFLGALAALTVFRLGEAFGGGGAAAAIVTWAAVCLTIPFAPHAWLIYPEIPAALVVGWSLLWMWRGDRSTGRLLAHGALLAVLPWLHTRFVVLTATLAAAEAWRLWPRRSRIGVFAAPIAAGILAWFGSFYWMYGTVDPQAAYGAFASTNVSMANVPHGVFGLLFDQKFGLLMYSPVFLVAGAGLVMIGRDRTTRWFAVVTAITGAVYLVSTTRFYMWWGGSSAPARFLVPALPLAAPAIAAAFARLRTTAARSAIVFLTLSSVAIAAACVLSPGSAFLYSSPHGTAALVAAAEGGAPLDSWLPTFTEEQWARAVLQLLMWISAGGVALAVAMAASRSRRTSLGGGAPALAFAAFVATAALIPGGQAIPDRDGFARRGQLALLHEYDAARLRAVDVGHLRRLAEPDVFQRLTIRPAVDESLELPAGSYVARAWRRGNGLPLVTATLAGGIVIAQKSGGEANPMQLSFELPIAAPVAIGGDATLQRVEIEPSRLPAGGARSGDSATGIEAMEGPSGSYIAYLDRHAYPEHGVFWTRGTEKARAVLVAAGGMQLELVLHVGPRAGTVFVEIGAQRLELKMNGGETRELSVPLAPRPEPVWLAVRASEPFRPASEEPASDDRRWLGCQVRPRVR